ncbi:ATP-binding cassette domain-containing protein, partial [Streptomyces sp. NPDC054837]
MSSQAITPLVEARGIVKRYGPTTALADGRLTVLPGESHALVGRNGAGKSTLVTVLTGLQAPDEGEVRFDGAPPPRRAPPGGRRPHGARGQPQHTRRPPQTQPPHKIKKP